MKLLSLCRHHYFLAAKLLEVNWTMKLIDAKGDNGSFVTESFFFLSIQSSIGFSQNCVENKRCQLFLYSLFAILLGAFC